MEGWNTYLGADVQNPSTSSNVRRDILDYFELSHGEQRHIVDQNNDLPQFRSDCDTSWSLLVLTPPKWVQPDRFRV